MAIQQSLLRSKGSVLILGLVVVAGASVSGCHPGIIESNWTLEDAREFHEFSLFWLGESHEGLPLTVTYRSQTVAQNIVRFVYGEPIRTQSAWTAPLHILIQPYCDSTPERTQTRLARYSDVGGSFRDVEVRGLRGILTGDESDGSVYVWTAVEASRSVRAEFIEPSSACQRRLSASKPQLARPPRRA